MLSEGENEVAKQTLTSVVWMLADKRKKECCKRILGCLYIVLEALSRTPQWNCRLGLRATGSSFHGIQLRVPTVTMGRRHDGDLDLFSLIVIAYHVP